MALFAVDLLESACFCFSHNFHFLLDFPTQKKLVYLYLYFNLIIQLALEYSKSKSDLHFNSTLIMCLLIIAVFIIITINRYSLAEQALTKFNSHQNRN
jgi:hypothetical protein